MSKRPAQLHGQSEPFTVLLTVAVVLVLAGAGVVFTIGITSQIPTVPQASFEISQTGSAADNEIDTTITITHHGGATISGENLRILIDRTPVANVTGVTTGSNSETVEAGETIQLTQTNADGFIGGETVSVVFVDQTKDSRVTLVTHEIRGNGDGSANVAKIEISRERPESQ